MPLYDFFGDGALFVKYHKMRVLNSVYYAPFYPYNLRRKRIIPLLYQIYSTTVSRNIDHIFDSTFRLYLVIIRNDLITSASVYVQTMRNLIY